MRAGSLFAFAALSLVLGSGCATIRKFSPIQRDTLEARQLTQQAQSAIHRDDWDGAEQKLLHAIERCPDDNRAHACLAEVYWNRGAKQAAIDQLSRAMELSGQEDVVALTRLGGMQLELGNPQAAAQHAESAIQVDKDHADAWTLKGRALIQLGNLQEGQNALFRSLSLRDHHLPTRIELARLLHRGKKPARALAILDAAESTDRGGLIAAEHGELCHLRGLLLVELQRPQDAATALAQARDAGRASPDLLVQLAESQLAAGQAGAAHRTLADLEGHPTASDARVTKLRAQVDARLARAGQPWR